MPNLEWRFRRSLRAVAVAAFAMACGETSTSPDPVRDPEVTRIQLLRNVEQLIVGARDSMWVRGERADGTWTDVRTGIQWQSSDSAVISVQPSGVVVATRSGVAFARAIVRLGTQEFRDSVRYTVADQLH